MKTKLYARGSRENAWNEGKKLGLTGEALIMFSYALYGIEVELEVDMKTGECEIISVDGRKLEKQS